MIIDKDIVNIDESTAKRMSQLSNTLPVRLSFQLMTRAEPVDVVIASIESLLAIKADDDEILIIDNNHTDTTLYLPLQLFCAGLDNTLNVRFYHVDTVAGFKAGALNLALDIMDARCTHIVVVDSDYQALPKARTSIIEAIERYPDHALLQFPQFYRDADLEDVHSELNHYFNYHLYRPSNRQRTLSTGTYAIIRRDALLSLGGWSGASITEDAQMGVLMHRQGLRSRFIPKVIATGLLPNTLYDLMSQRRRWIYGNAQVLKSYFSIRPLLLSNSHSLFSRGERLKYIQAHFSQLSAWINFTGIFILSHIFILLLIIGTLLMGKSLNPSTLLAPLYAVYISYAWFLGRRLWAYLQDSSPLSLQVNNQQTLKVSKKIRAWLLHLNFWELGALSWMPVLWGRDKPFICTPKQKLARTRRAVWTSNLIALPKLLLLLNAITALIVAPFSLFYSPILFICALTVCLLKLWAAQVMFANYAYVETSKAVVTTHPVTASPAVIANPSVSTSTQEKFASMANKMTKEPLIDKFKDKKVVNS